MCARLQMSRRHRSWPGSSSAMRRFTALLDKVNKVTEKSVQRVLLKKTGEKERIGLPKKDISSN